ncbi:MULTISPECIES: type III effector [Pseudomonas syringae group]|nr:MULTISPECIES: type III effector [Pseudomonas syringae group]KPY75822.1 hypothetical protein ALO58_200010 [Pseudomonas savastanoi pv. savastanoi]RMN66727.1 hypothetical protein ALQ55_200077 [Pseudomonas savastanoi pv. savastanoi]RMR26757.1 hypothetical protein ALP89_200226 [Pseudomonas syringae pv. persicae]UKL12823.1 hypothetical protein HQ966_28890 [Pseudomonas savastanoi pv. savastanoi]
MPGINGAGPSNFFWHWRTDGEPVTEREHDSSSSASSANSPELPPPASPAESGRRRLLRSPPLSGQIREWVEQNIRQEAEPQSSSLNRAARLANSPELPPPASPAESGRRRLLRSPPLSGQIREWVEQNIRQEAEPQSSSLNRAARLAAMPPQEHDESNVAYAIRLRRLNPGADVSRVVASFITDPAARQQVVDDIRAALDIAPQFNQLRTISRADAESEELGFRDAADHPDNATPCLFGEELSLSNPDQQVIGLAVNPTDKPQPYSQEVNKALTFMDMKKLAQYLADKPEHPLNRQRLDAETIAKYAFRIVP